MLHTSNIIPAALLEFCTVLTVQISTRATRTQASHDAGFDVACIKSTSFYPSRCVLPATPSALLQRPDHHADASGMGQAIIDIFRFLPVVNGQVRGSGT